MFDYDLTAKIIESECDNDIYKNLTIFRYSFMMIL